MNRRKQSNKDFTEKQYADLHNIIQLTDDSLTQMNRVMQGRREEQDINETFRIENEINGMRDRLKEDNIRAINEHEYDYSVGTMYTDLVSECEKLGDYVVNVVEARLGR
jgi:phosphate:Na+ symporter